VQEVDSTQFNIQRRRSERVSESLPLIVRGVDLLGQPFEERTSTLALNLHGCRYASKHHLPKNTWVTLELPQARDRRNVRARVAWIQRPHSVRELFQIAVELESPSNIWGIESVPTDWNVVEASKHASFTVRDLRVPESPEARVIPAAVANSTGKLMTDMSSATPASASEPTLFTPAADSPLLRELRAELERHATQAVEAAASQAHQQMRQSAEEMDRKRSAAFDDLFSRWKVEYEMAQSNAREEFSSELTARQVEFLTGLKADFEQNFGRARALMAEMDGKSLALRAENEAVQDAISRAAQTRLQMEADEAARDSKREAALRGNVAATGEAPEAARNAANTDWRQRLESEMAVAQGQWNELLQSALDSRMQQLVEQMSERSQEILHGAEEKMSERFAELHQPFAQTTAEAREASAGIKSALEQEVARAWSSLAEIEHTAGRMKEYAAQLDAASHDSLNELHRRLESILETQTAELNHRAENLAAGLSQRVAPSLDSLGRQFVERTVAEVESKLAPHVERVPELLRELATREVQVEDGLRLHRERLRQVSENNQREASAQMTSTLGELRNNFEAARKEALAKWTEELDASGVRASHVAAESIGKSSEWFQQEARARLQVQVEQALASAGTGFDQKTAEASQKFETQLSAQSAATLGQIEQQLKGVASELVGTTHTRLEDAAAAAAASFGQVLRDISESEVQQFTTASGDALHARTQEFEHSSQQLLRNLESAAGTSLEYFHAQMATELEARTTEGRAALAAEFESALSSYRAERDSHQKVWLATLEQMSGEVADHFQERLQTTGDSWVLSSVRRLNEHGQNAVESLMRSADQSLRDSCAKLFDGLSEMLRDRATNAAGVSGFTPTPSREVAESKPTPRNEAT
jgi:hypothetical protein